MTQGLKTAIEEVNQLISAKLTEVAELKRSVNALCREAGLDPQYTDATVEQAEGRRVVLRPDTFYGRPLATAVREHLEAVRHAMPVQEILVALEQGGFDFDSAEWTIENRLRNLAISLSKNPLFKRLPSGVVGLRAWYQEPKPTASQKKRPKRHAQAHTKASARKTDKKTTEPTGKTTDKKTDATEKKGKASGEPRTEAPVH